MEKGVLLLVFCFSIYVRSAPTDSEMVWLKDVTSSLQTDERKFSGSDLPDNLSFELKRGSRALRLNLKRNHGIDPNADVYFVRKSNEGRPHLDKVQNLEKEDLAYYLDGTNGAFMTVRCVRRSNGQCDRVINGNILIEERNYDLQPAKTDITSRDFFNVPHLSTLYVLRDQANVETEISVTRKEAITAVEKNVEHEVKDILRRYPNEQKDFPSPSSMLFSKKGASLYNRDNQKQVYSVEIAVVLDSSIWDFFSLLMQTNHSTEIARDLRRFYSHVINGASLPYKTIKDPEIEINLILSEIHILQRMEDFNHHESVVETEDGRKLIDIFNYLRDFQVWTSVNSKLSDHAILFTRYILHDSLYGGVFNGYSYFWYACDEFLKISIVRTRDYYLTAATSARQLAFNLGVEHDGKGFAEDCNPEDQFIMAREDPIFNKTTPYSRNLWIFSNCSVEVLKSTLQDKMCLTNVGEFMKSQPGEDYSVTKQCQFFKGQGSVFCGNIAEVCRFMQCTDPVSEQCLPVFLIAAPGTYCGQNKWCQEGLCVSKSSN